MTEYTFSIVIPANSAAPINVATAAVAGGAILSVNSMFSATYLPATRVTYQMARGGTGAGFVGGPGLTFQGAGAAYELTAATSTVPGGVQTIESHQDSNVIQLGQQYVHGAVPGDTMTVTYYQD